ncbi:MAG TPA: hypothetical protein VEC35_16350 [Noviherbaspirillum sp.]|nr:hypothetical protein [Noviherbaspirillum sp.]
MMNYSRFGALAQAFIINAIQASADEVSAMPIEELRKQFGGAFISADSWHGVATEIKEKMAKFYGRHDSKATTGEDVE